MGETAWRPHPPSGASAPGPQASPESSSIQINHVVGTEIARKEIARKEIAWKEIQRNVRPGPSTVGRRMTARTRTFSQAPRAVRSAGGRRWDGALPASAPAGRTFQADKRDAVSLTVQVHRLRHKSTTAAIRAVVRSHSSPPSWLKTFLPTCSRIFRRTVLRYESRTEFAGEEASNIRKLKRGHILDIETGLNVEVKRIKKSTHFLKRSARSGHYSV